MNKFEELIDKISLLFKSNNWQWDTSSFKGIPTREMIRDDIVEKIRRLSKEENVLRYVSSGRILVIKTVDSGSDGDFVEYDIAIDKQLFTEDELESYGVIKG